MEDPQPPLASSEVRYVGEAVAVVVAADATTARDAADLLEVNYEVLPAVADARAAVKLGAPFVSPLAADNLGASAVFDDASVTADAFAACDVVVEHDFRVPRVANAQMEARGALGAYDSATHSYLMIAGSQGVVRQRQMLVAALGEQGALLGTASFPTNLAGYAQLHDWLQDFGAITSVGIEGTGSYGAGLCRFLQAAGVPVSEVSRPKRLWRRRYGKSDPRDAEAAGRAVLAGEALGIPQQRDGMVEAIRMLRMARRSAIKARTQTTNQLRAVLDTAPDELREPLRSLSAHALVAIAQRWRPGAPTGPLAAARVTLKLLAERWTTLSAELNQLDAQLAPLIAAAAPELLATHGVGADTAAALLVASGDNPERLGSEASFAALCGVSPVDASSGRQHATA